MTSKLIVLLIGRVLLVVGSIVSVRFYTQILGPHEVGIMNLVLSAVGLFGLLLGSVSSYFYRQVLEWHDAGLLLVNIERYAKFILAAATACCAVIVVPYWLGDQSWRGISLPWLWFLIGGGLCAVSLNGALLYTINTLGFRVPYVVLSNVTTWLGIITGITLTLAVDAKAVYWLAGAFVGQVVSLALCTTIVVKTSQGTANEPTEDAPPGFHFGVVARFSWPMVISVGFYWLQRSSYAPMMAALNDVRTLGLFSAAYSVGVLAIASFDTLFKDYYSPIYYRAIANSPDAVKVAAWNEYMRAFVPAVVGVSLFIAAFGNPLLTLLVSDEFHGLGSVVAWGALSQALISIYSMYVILASTFMDNKVLLLPNFVGALVVVLGLYLWLPSSPLTAAGISINLGLLATSTLIALRLRRLHAIRFPTRRLLVAIAMVAPLGIVAYLDTPRLAGSSVRGALVLLAIGGVYLLAVQYGLARRWLRRRSMDPDEG